MHSEKPSHPRSRGLLKLLGIEPPYRTAVLKHSAAWILFGIFSAGAAQQIGFVIKKTGGSPALVSLVITGTSAVSILTMLYVSYFERYRVRLLVAVPRIIGAALFLAASICREPVGLTITGFFAISISRLGNTFYGRLLSRLYPVRIRGRMQSFPMFLQGAFAAGTSVLAGWALKTAAEAYRWVLPAAGVIGIASAVMVLGFPVGRAPEPSAAAKPSPRAKLKTILLELGSDKPFLMWALIYSATSLGFWIAHSAKPVYFESVLSFSYLENGIVLAFFNGTYCLSFLLWGRTLDRLRSIITMMTSWTIVGVGTLITVTGRSYGWAIVGEALAGIGLSGNDLAWFTVVLEFAPAGRIDRYMAFYMTIFGVRALIGGIIGGTLMETLASGSQVSLFLGGLVMIFGAAAMLILRNRAIPDKDAGPEKRLT